MKSTAESTHRRGTAQQSLHSTTTFKRWLTPQSHYSLITTKLVNGKGAVWTTSLLHPIQTIVLGGLCFLTGPCSGECTKQNDWHDRPSLVPWALRQWSLTTDKQRDITVFGRMHKNCLSVSILGCSGVQSRGTTLDAPEALDPAEIPLEKNASHSRFCALKWLTVTLFFPFKPINMYHIVL